MADSLQEGRVQLSPNFFLDEFTRSETAARNGRDVVVVGGSPVLYALTALCAQVLQPLRDALGPVHITSGYRPFWLERLLSGVAGPSQHAFGLAADIVVTGHPPLAVCRWIETYLPYDQVIHEFGQWCHVSIAGDGVPRGEPLTAVKRDSRTVYLPGLLSLADASRVA